MIWSKYGPFHMMPIELSILFSCVIYDYSAAKLF